MLSGPDSENFIRESLTDFCNSLEIENHLLEFLQIPEDSLGLRAGNRPIPRDEELNEDARFADLTTCGPRTTARGSWNAGMIRQGLRLQVRLPLSSLF
jgi:hypothetical protein